MKEDLLKELIRSLISRHVKEHDAFFVYEQKTSFMNVLSKSAKKSQEDKFIREFEKINPEIELFKHTQKEIRFRPRAGSKISNEEFVESLESVLGILKGSLIKNYLPGSPGSRSGKFMTHHVELSDDVDAYVVFSSKTKMDPVLDQSGLPTYFGGAEAAQINAMNSEIRKVASKDGVNIKIGERIISNVGAILQIGGTVKADAYFAEIKNGKIDHDMSRALAFISLKNASQPSEMNQWGGMSKLLEDKKINEEYKNFIRDLKSYLRGLGSSGEMPPGEVFRKPCSNQIARKACYGIEYSRGNSSSNSVDMIYICDDASVVLKPVAHNTYVFAGGKSYYDGKLPIGEWEPYFYARRGDRNDAGIKNCRIGIFPRDYRPF